MSHANIVVCGELERYKDKKKEKKKSEISSREDNGNKHL